MARLVRNLDSLILRALLDQYGRARADAYRAGASPPCHADASLAIVVADATDLPSAILVVNACKTSVNAHVASVCSGVTGQGAHLAADTTNPITAPDATDQASLVTLLGQLKDNGSAHFRSKAAHAVPDAGAPIAAAAGTDAPSFVAAANATKARLNTHYALAMLSQAIKVVPA